ncbi:hypothetical protein GCM10009744_06380 [Kribbella alba]|uniref:Transposase IS701-like DDE domain-containing protein n=1 Tax=Kribbella alba TaxID=190197 RepID=A0ABN2F108_9ACTN
MSWPTAHTALVEVADRVLGSPAPVLILGVDETRRGKPRWEHDASIGKWRRWHSGFCDLSGDQGLLGQVLGGPAAT